MKFLTFWKKKKRKKKEKQTNKQTKKNEPYILSISEIIHSQKLGYLNTLQVLPHKTIRQSTC